MTKASHFKMAKMNLSIKYVGPQHISILFLLQSLCVSFLIFQTNDGSSDNTNYDVELGKSTDFEAITWHFPDTNQCPVKQCMLSFSHRSVAFFHFCVIHANKIMICTICDELILAENSQDLLQHYRDMHASERSPKLKTVSHFF